MEGIFTLGNVLGVGLLGATIAAWIVMFRRKPSVSQRVRTDDFDETA